MKKDTVVLGGGIAGIAAAYFLGEERAAIYEAKSQYGGLLDNFSINGFRFDYAVHLSFTKNKLVRSIFDQVNFITHVPNPHNYYKGNWYKHPIQNNLYPLPIDEKVKAITDFVNRPNIDTQNNNYETWLYQQYGKYISENFPIRYTKKYWGTEAKELTTDWIGNRMYRPTLEEVLYGAMTDQTPNTYYAQEMRYPKIGGYKSFLEPMSKECHFHLNKKAVSIHPVKKYVEFQDGSKVYFENLISSLPLPEVIPLIVDAPNEIKEAAEKLVATSITLVSVGFSRRDIPQYLWLYIYDEDKLPARVYSPSLKSPDNVPAGYSSLQFEIYHSPYNKQEVSDEFYIHHVLENIQSMSLADPNEILFIDCKKVKYANVIFNKEMKKNREKVKKYLDENGIISVGRFGEWGYLWSDQSLLSGMTGAKKILLKGD